MPHVIENLIVMTSYFYITEAVKNVTEKDENPYFAKLLQWKRFSLNEMF